ncbi:MAG: tellurite resistance TerB family protein [Pseudomonadota bacterium]
MALWGRKPAGKLSWTETLEKFIRDYRKETPLLAQVPPELVRGFVAPSIYVMLSDGARQGQEEMQLLAMLTTSPVLRGIKPSDFGVIIDEVIAGLGPIGGADAANQMRALVEPLPERLRSPAYVFAARMAYADQQQSPEEREALTNLQKWLGVPHSEAERIDRVLSEMVTAPPVG